MTSEKIKEWESLCIHTDRGPLWEIAYQLAVMNERQKAEEEKKPQELAGKPPLPVGFANFEYTGEFRPPMEDEWFLYEDANGVYWKPAQALYSWRDMETNRRWILRKIA